TEAHLVVGEELVVVERVALIDGAQSLDVDRPVHDVFVHGPFEQVGEQEGQRHGQPLPPAHVVDVFDVDIKRGGAYRVDDGDVEIAVVPADDARAILVAEFDLALTNHPRISWRQPDISHMYHGAASLAIRSGSRLSGNEIIDIRAAEPPVIVEIGNYGAHEQVGQVDGAQGVAEMVEKDRQRQLLRALPLIGPLEAVFGEALDLVVLRQWLAVDGHDEAVNGA